MDHHEIALMAKIVCLLVWHTCVYGVHSLSRLALLFVLSHARGALEHTSFVLLIGAAVVENLQTSWPERKVTYFLFVGWRSR
jgi:hypothetical protein